MSRAQVLKLDQTPSVSSEVETRHSKSTSLDSGQGLESIPSACLAGRRGTRDERVPLSRTSSDLWQGVEAQPARIGSWSDLSPEESFRPLYGLDQDGFTPLDTSFFDGEVMPADPDAMDPPVEQLTAEAFAQGFDEGVRTARAELESDRAAHLRLALALEQLQPQSSGALSALLSTAVLRLVRQIAGEVAVDAELLEKRCLAIAECIEAEVGQPALYMHPDDIALMRERDLPVRLAPDEEMLRGSVRLETADGWVEDGPEIRLSRLQALLDELTGRS